MTQSNKRKPHPMKISRAWFYSHLIEPLLRGIREQICSSLTKSATCIDIGCGTGALSFDLAKNATRVFGVDMDADRITLAKQLCKNTPHQNVEFLCADATNLNQFKDEEFDYATISLLLHSVPDKIALKILREAKRVAKKIIIAEFVTPQPRGIYKAFFWILEAMAGRDHFNSFVSYKKNGGIEHLLEQVGLQVEQRVLRPCKAIEVVAVSTS